MCVPAAQFWCSSELPVGPGWSTSCSPFPQRVGLQACVYVDHNSARSTCASVTKENCSSTALLEQSWKIMHFQCRKNGKREWMAEKKSTQNCDLDCKWDSTSRLTKKVNKRSVQQPVWVQVVLILQFKSVCVCFGEEQVTSQVKSSGLSTPSWDRTCCFPLLHHSVLWSSLFNPCIAA